MITFDGRSYDPRHIIIPKKISLMKYIFQVQSPIIRSDE